MNKQRTVAVILARAGSKGVPGKNVAPVAGRPCIAWTIEHALNTRAIGDVIVTTDDPRAAAVARDHGVCVVHRPPALAGDTATVDDAVRHAVEQAAPGLSARDACVVLYANVPVRPVDLSERALAMLRSSGADSVQSYSPVGKHHPWWTVRVEGGSGVLSPWEGDVLYHDTYRRQDLPPAYVPDGGVVAVTIDALFRRIPGVSRGPHAFLGHKRRAIVSPEGSVVDIDTRVDLLVADAILRGALAEARSPDRFARAEGGGASAGAEPGWGCGRRAS